MLERYGRVPDIKGLMKKLPRCIMGSIGSSSSRCLLDLGTKLRDILDPAFSQSVSLPSPNFMKMK